MDEIPLGSIKRYRRVKKHDGDDFASDMEDELAKVVTLKSKGLLCRNHGKWIPWDKLAIRYDYNEGVTMMRWVCECGATLKEELI